MAPTQFRQIGVQNSRRVNTEVRRWLKLAQRRTERLLNKQKLPPARTILKTLDVLYGATQSANEYVARQRLVESLQRLAELKETVERNSHFHAGAPVNILVDLRRYYRDISSLLVEYDSGKKPAKYNENAELGRFLTAATQRGWRVRAPKEDETDADGFQQSMQYIHQVSVSEDALLGHSTRVGLATAPLLILSDSSIPESVLQGWTESPTNKDVFVVFGHYIVIPDCQFIGIGTAEGIYSSDLDFVADQLHSEGLTTGDVLPFSRMIKNHVYRPIVRVPAEQRRYFRRWDMLVNKDRLGKRRLG